VAENTPTHTPDDCESCTALALVTEAGGRALTKASGIDWDALTPHQKAHYGVIATDVMDAMSEALVETGLVKPKETDQ
jgi:hypothetical protein